MPEDLAPVQGDWRWFSEDGYCVDCGNGWWKWHMPSCNLSAADDDGNRPLVEALLARYHWIPDVES